jgi:hypothetical protein
MIYIFLSDKLNYKNHAAQFKQSFEETAPCSSQMLEIDYKLLFSVCNESL